MITQICTICNQSLPESMFYRNPTTQALKRQCRPCEADKKRIAYHANPSKFIKRTVRSRNKRRKKDIWLRMMDTRRFYFPNRKNRIITSDKAECIECGEAKPHAEFTMDHGIPKSRCKPCFCKYAKRLRERRK